MTPPIKPVPLPAPGEELMARPTPDEVTLTVAGVVGAATPPGGLTAVQIAYIRLLIERHVLSELTGDAPVPEAP